MPAAGLPTARAGSKIVCTLDCAARTFSYSVDGGATAVAFKGLPKGRVLYPAVCTASAMQVRTLKVFYCVPHIRLVVRTRVMCLAGRARTAGAHGHVVAWLCERAPLWVVVHVCALLREE